MKKIKIIFSISFLISSTYLIAQIQPPITEQPFIEVTGTAEKEVIPDEIYIGIIIREKYINKTKVSIEEQEEKLKSIIKSLGIELNNLFLSDANADYVKIKWQKKDVLTKKDYTLKLTNATTVGQLFVELEKIEINDAFVSSVSHSKMEILKKEVKIEAIKAAKDKADYLLNAINEQTGKPLIIKENDILNHRKLSSVSANILINSNGFVEKDKYDDNHEIQFQKIKIQSSIYVKFSIK
jgi:uncharacterized protein YggE